MKAFATRALIIILVLAHPVIVLSQKQKEEPIPDQNITAKTSSPKYYQLKINEGTGVPAKKKFLIS